MATFANSFGPVSAKQIASVEKALSVKLPADYKRGTGTDSRVCRFLGVEYPALVGQVLAGGTDEELLEWCLVQGRRPNDEEIFMFNAFLSKRGWRDNQTAELEQMKREPVCRACPDARQT